MRKRFAKINVEIGNICNLQCSFCPEVIRSKKLMEPEVFRGIIEQIAPLTELVCLHLMGDPLVHPKLAELVEICHENKVKIFFVTNGVLMHERHRELLLHPAFHQVSFSLHSFADNFGDKDPSIYLDRIFEFTETAFEKAPELYLNYRLWNLSDPRGKEGKNEDMLRRIAEKFSVSVPSFVDVQQRKSFRLKRRLFLHFDTEFIWPASDLPVLGTKGTCRGLSSHFGILADGTVVPCCLDKEGLIPLGNAREQSVLSILESPRAQAILKGFRARKLVESLCQRCQYVERFKRPFESAAEEKQ